MQRLISGPDTSAWYATQYGCLRTDPTLIASRHTFPDVALPIGIPETPAPFTRVCQQYRTAWPMETRSAASLVDTERVHPQFAFRVAYGPATQVQVDEESDLRRLNVRNTNCQPVIPMDAPLFQNTVAPPTPIAVPINVQNAANPIAALISAGGGGGCREAADQVASAMSGRWVNNPTRQDTARFLKPFGPPGIGSSSTTTLSS